MHKNPLNTLSFLQYAFFPHIGIPCFPPSKTSSFYIQWGGNQGEDLKAISGFFWMILICPSGFYQQSKPKDSDKEGTSNSTSEDGPGDGFTILSSKSLVLGQKVIKKVVMCCHKALLFTGNDATFNRSFPDTTFTLVLYSFLNEKAVAGSAL